MVYCSYLCGGLFFCARTPRHDMPDPEGELPPEGGTKHIKFQEVPIKR